VNDLMDIRVPRDFRKFLSNCTTSGFSRRVQLHDVSALTIPVLPRLFYVYLRKARNKMFNSWSQKWNGTAPVV
jgi:hypothetical protein